MLTVAVKITPSMHHSKAVANIAMVVREMTEEGELSIRQCVWHSPCPMIYWPNHLLFYEKLQPTVDSGLIRG